ncbi:MAG: hypothetical protein H6917_18055 [Novosphingobium sp.]|nr:hypothetical protein [Novosphingobium sp.]MCP5404281.1 hypothetical protein [Novosphingobium sp.]
METKEQALTKAHGPNSRRTIEYSYVMKGILDDAKLPGFTDAQWDPLGDLVNIPRFERTGNFMEVVNWQQYVPLLSTWSKATGWTFDVRRITEGEGYAILELTEHADYPDRQETYNSVSIYEFDDDGKLVRLGIFLQMKAPPEANQAHQWDLEGVGAQS